MNNQNRVTKALAVIDEVIEQLKKLGGLCITVDTIKQLETQMKRLESINIVPPVDYCKTQHEEYLKRVAS